MGYFGCGALMQFSVMALTMIALVCGIVAWYGDFVWKSELERIRVVFTEDEAVLLERNGLYYEIVNLSGLLILHILSVIHTFLCFYKQHSFFHKSTLAITITLIIGLGLIIMSASPIITAWVYDTAYTQIQQNDARIYSYQIQVPNGSVYSAKANSIFYYCHYGNGRPLHWSRLKGIRIKKYGSHICQSIGLRYISAFLTLYAGSIYLLTLKVLDSRHRDKIAAHIALLFDLFGDLEESVAENTATINPDGEEHFGVHLDMQAYKRALIESSFEKTTLPPKLEEWLRTGKYREGDDAHYDRRIVEPNRYHVSPFPDENVARGVPEYMTKIMQTRLEIKSAADEKNQEEKEAKHRMIEKRREWQAAREQRLRAKNVRTAAVEPK